MVAIVLVIATSTTILYNNRLRNDVGVDTDTDDLYKVNEFTVLPAPEEFVGAVTSIDRSNNNSKAEYRLTFLCRYEKREEIESHG